MACHRNNLGAHEFFTANSNYVSFNVGLTSRKRAAKQANVVVVIVFAVNGLVVVVVVDFGIVQVVAIVVVVLVVAFCFGYISHGSISCCHCRCS